MSTFVPALVRLAEPESETSFLDDHRRRAIRAPLAVDRRVALAVVQSSLRTDLLSPGNQTRAYPPRRPKLTGRAQRVGEAASGGAATSGSSQVASSRSCLTGSPRRMKLSESSIGGNSASSVRSVFHRGGWYWENSDARSKPRPPIL